MSGTTQEEIYRTFVAVSGKQASNLDEVAHSLASVVAQVNQMQPGQSVPPPQTKAPTQTEQSQTTAPEPSTASKVQSAMEASQAGLIPLIIDLFGMFSGGSSTPPPLVKYAMPSKINFQGADTSSGVSNVDYGQDGMPRAYTPGGRQTPPAPQVTVNVQAMDSRSFMDRSQDIAAAVRDAMLNLNSINDVVNDL